jgi:hypothetical protein
VERYERIERKRVKERGGKKVLNSGRTWHSKGDVVSGPFLEDTKDALDAKSFSLNFKKFEKHLHDALKAGKEGSFIVYWKDSLGRTRRAAIVEDHVLNPLFDEVLKDNV